MTDDRIAALEQKIAEAQLELQALKAGKAAPPLPSPRDEVRIVAINDERRTDLPDLRQMQKLFSIVRTRVPQAKTHDDDAPFRGFCGAFRYVSNCGRIAALNGKVSLTWWLEGMTAWLRERNAMTGDVTGASFIAAVFASGDTLYVPHNSTLGHVWEFGIVPPGHGGKPASDAWKRVLDGSVLAPSQPGEAHAAAVASAGYCRRILRVCLVGCGRLLDRSASKQGEVGDIDPGESWGRFERSPPFCW